MHHRFYIHSTLQITALLSLATLTAIDQQIALHAENVEI